VGYALIYPVVIVVLTVVDETSSMVDGGSLVIVGEFIADIKCGGKSSKGMRILGPLLVIETLFNRKKAFQVESRACSKRRT